MGDMTIIGSVSVEQYNEGVRATAILGAICDMLRDGTGYASDSIYSILGIKKEGEERCLLDSDPKKEKE